MKIVGFQKLLTKLGNVFMAICLLALNSGSAQNVQAAAGDTIRVSVASDGTSGNGDSYSPSISADGRYVAFVSEASNLVSADTNDTGDVFVHDQQNGQTTRVAVASDGTQGNAVSDSAAISADGRYVAFRSAASNLVSGDANDRQDIFVHDRLIGQTTRVSVATDGTQGNDNSAFPSISADGRYVAFLSVASNLVVGDTNDTWDIFVHDQQSGQTTRVSVASDGTQGNSSSFYLPSISGDGRYVTFTSGASNLVSGDTNGQADIFVHDRQTGQTTRVSVTSGGTEGNSDSQYPSISADGRYVAFTSYATNLGIGGTTGIPHGFVHDRQTGQTTPVWAASDCTAWNPFSAVASISVDGRYIAMASTVSIFGDVFVSDQQSGQTMRVSVASDGTHGTSNSGGGSISADGHYVAFSSNASNLVSGDMNGTSDVFLHENAVSIAPFLELPIQYTDFPVSSNGNVGNNPGRVNSWFDHNPSTDTVTTWTGNTYTGAAETGVKTCNRISCYDGHNAIDFQNAQTNEQIFAAANGTVINTLTNPLVSNCQNSVGGCKGYGNRVWIDHGNGYATLYGHLASVSVTTATIITNPLAQPLGIMGSTGNSNGTHLHFGLYYDKNNDGVWCESEVADPYGWSGSAADPWNTASTYLWIHSLVTQEPLNNSGGSVTSPSGLKTVTVPSGAVDGLVTLEMWDFPPVSEPSVQLRSSGDSLLMKVLEWLTGGSANTLIANTSTQGFNLPVTVTINFDPSSMPHIDVNQLAIQQWDDIDQEWIPLTTTIDNINNQASAETTRPGYFDLQGPLVCPADTLEPNDNYDGSSVPTNGSSVNNLFDIVQDEDWFQFDGYAGNNYTVSTANLSTGVDTIVEVYDTDGVTLLASDDNSGGGNASSLTWQAPNHGVYFVRVRQEAGSAYGCVAGYELGILDITPPTVFSIARADPNPTSAASVHFTVTFAESVTGVTANDFELYTPGVTGAVVTNVTPVSGTTYTATVNTGSGNGTIRLDVVDDNTIVDAASNPLGGVNVGDGDYLAGDVYTVDKTAGTCGSGTWTPGNLEIHHIDIGQGDSALIVGPTGKSLLLDVGEENYNSSAKAQIIGPYIEAVLGCTTLDYVLISHFHLDHIGYVGFGGLWHLVESQGFTVGMTLVRDYNSYLGDTSGTLTNWKTYLESAGQSTLHPVTAVEGTSQVDLGTGVTLDIVAVDGNGALIAGNFSGDASPPSENDYSIGAVLSYGNFDEWLGGDLDGQYETGGFGYTYHDIELSVAPEVGDVDVYKANHHGSSHSSSATFLNQLDPEVSVVSEGNGNSYGHPTQATMDRLLATSTVYLTERGELTTNIGSAIVAGNIVIKTSNGTAYTVNGTAYTATEPTRTDTDGDGYFTEADPDDNNTSLTPAPNGGCGAIYQTCSVACEISAGQVLINEVLPAPSSGPEWVELYNTTNSTLNLGYCRIDDIAAGSPIYQIPAGTLIPAHGFWTLDRTTYFNNTGDDVRFLAEDGSTVLDSHTYGNTGSNLSWYRFPNGGAWALSAIAATTKGQSNNTPFSPIVLSIARTDPNPTSATSVGFTVTFSEAVTGVNTSAPFSDFALTTTGVTGAAITSVSGSGATFTVTVNTGSGIGTIRLNVVDDDSIRDATNNPLGGVGIGNGNFTNGEIYNVIRNIMISGNAGVGGVTLSYTDNGPKTATASGSGNYSITVPYGWSGVVTPSKAGYTFSPVNRSYANVTTNKTAQNYTAVPIRYTISGNVGASGITLNYTDGTPKTAISQANGNYSFTVPYNWSGTVTPVPTCYTFTPTSKTYVNVLANQAAQNYTAVFNGASGCSNISIDIGGNNQGNYGVAPQTSTRDSYPINNGPVKATSPNAVPFLIAERDAWLLNGVVQSFSEMMGLPGNQVTDTYYFPWYNNVTMDTQLRFANLGNTATNITVTIAGVPQPVIPLAAGVSTRVSYAGINAGPVKVTSSGGVPIIVAERDAWLLNGVVQSFSEMMGLPGNQLTDTYYFPWYNNVTMDTQLRFANLGNVPTTINVTIAGTPQTPIPLAAGQSTRMSYAINNGSVKVQSTGGVPIIVAERDAWLINGVVRSFSEMMGLPGNQLTDTYHFPWYNNVTMDTQLRFANLGVAPTNITVTIAGIAQPVIPLAAGVSTRVSYVGINNGPVTVTSSGGVPIIVAERDAWLLNGAVRSFSEMMGLPGNQLTTTYYFPWYNNVTMDTQLRFAMP